ncbi:MAG: hypothetical protein E6713_07790 [Sporomusaceae bacterium]|nr:hypothetical protein [Sporomusaceae bacterium]
MARIKECSRQQTEVEEFFGTLPELTGAAEYLKTAQQIRISVLHEIAQMIKDGKMKRNNVKVMGLVSETQCNWWIRHQKCSVLECLIATT